ncbi:recombinase RecT [Sporolactobacillus terrae]|uniref:recombinase RecT n=1 Tax=Sporolactobacillus terrae TaxID=269673 RepID=UPI0009DD705C|nr:recombinase RecT [Sporolactobacillus terrae]
MATASKLKNQIANRNNAPGEGIRQYDLKQLMNSDTLKRRFNELLDKKAPQFMSSVLNLYNSETQLQKVQPLSIVSSAMVAASLDLPVDKNLGYAWIIPYGNVAQFQMGYKGYIQLALRTGQYKHINVISIHEGELKSWNPLTEEIEIDFTEKESDKVIGYAAYFELINGFKKTVYWTKEQVEKHKQRFSKSDFGWKRDWDAMATKTVLKALLSKWGILSIDMQAATTKDETVRQLVDGDDGLEDKEVIDIDPHELSEAQQTIAEDSSAKTSSQSKDNGKKDAKMTEPDLPSDEELPF